MQTYNSGNDYGFKQVIQESLIIPKGPSFEKLIELFTDDDEDIQ